MNLTAEKFTSDKLTLQGQLSLPETSESLWLPTLLICQDFPHGREDFSFLDTDLAELATAQLGWAAFAFGYRNAKARGGGGKTRGGKGDGGKGGGGGGQRDSGRGDRGGGGKGRGNISFSDWQRDISAAVKFLRAKRLEEIWIAGFGVGATLGLCAAAQNPQVQGVAAVSAFGDLKSWSKSSSAAGDSATGGAPGGPAAGDSINAVNAAKELAPRPLLVIHGQDDPLAPSLDARAIADAHGQASLRVLENGGHNIRYDPRTLALLFGWLDRNRS